MPILPSKLPALVSSLLVSACAHHAAPAAPAPTTTAPEPAKAAPACVPDAALSAADHIAKHGSVLDAYHRESGVWLPHAPVLINRDFDFAIAMSLEGVGAGLAAAKRREGNEKRAGELAELKLAPEAEARLAALRCRGTNVYFLVWGEEVPAVQLVVDEAGDPAKSQVVPRETWEPGRGTAVLAQQLADALVALEPAANTR